MDQDTGKRWYLIHTKPCQERIALAHLERQHYVVYLPYRQFHKRVRGVFKQVTEPMFARYLFIQLSDQYDNWGPIRSTRGVAGLVRFGGVAANVPDRLVNLVKDREQGVISSSELKVGDRVQVIDGVMQGYTGIIQEKSSKKRATLLLEMLDKTQPVHMAITMLESVI